MPRRFLLGLALVSPLILGYPVMGDQFMNINFSGDTVGNPPATDTSAPPAGPITKPYSIGGYGPATTDPFGDSPPTATDGTALVNNAGTMTKALVMSSDSANDQQGAVYLDTSYSRVADQFKLSFDVDVLGTAPTGNAQKYNLNNAVINPIGIILGVNEYTASGSSIFGFGAAPTSTTGGLFGLRNPNLTEFDSFGSYVVGATNHIELDADFSTQTVDAYINGTLAVANYPMKAGKSSNDLTETFAFVNADPGFVNSVALDNIQASVPEPASISLVLLSGSGLLLRRRRQV